MELFLKIALQSAEALVAAHEKRLVHRDIKPENIMLTSAGEVKILDFGVARRLRHTDPQALTDSDASQFEGGLTGTIAYMAPEVLTAKESDGRADIFSLGIVFYEVLAGKHPFMGPNLITTTDRILHEIAPPPSKVNPRAPAQLDPVIGKMLAKNPSERYTGAGELLADFQSLDSRTTPAVLSRPKLRRGSRWGIALAATILFSLALVLIPAVRQRVLHRSESAPALEPKSLVVLPFRSIGGGPEDQIYCDGMTETLTAKLSQLTATHELAIAPASEVRAQQVTNAEAARKNLGGTLVLAGTLFRSGQKVRINYELVDTKTLRQLRGDTITADASDPFAVQDQVVEGVVRTLDLALGPGERRAMVTHGTQVAGAYDLYLQGRGYLRNYDKPENIDSAIAVFNRALKLDSGYALAYAGLGEALWRKYENTKLTQWVGSARESCERAAATDPKAAEAHVCLGTVYNGTGRYESATAEFQRALEEEPTRDDAYRGLASAYENLGKPKEAEETFRRAVNLRPRYWAGYNALGIFYYRKARYPEAAEMFQKVVQLSPESVRAYSNLGGTYILQGRYEDAIPMFQRAVAIRPEAEPYSNLGTSYFYLRRFADSVRSYKEALKLSDQLYVVWGNLGDAYFWSSDHQEEAAAAYEKAITLAAQNLRVNPRDATALGNLAYYQAMRQEKAAATGNLNRALAIAPRDPELLFNAAVAYSQMGEDDRALVALKKALEAGYSANLVRDTPMFGKLRQNPRFRDILGEK